MRILYGLFAAVFLRLKSGGKAVYRLSGLLKCGVCGRNYVIDGSTHYACPSSRNGACTNKMRQHRLDAEHHILGEIDRRLLDPQLVQMMAKEIAREFARRTAAHQKGADRSAELVALDERIARLKKRLRDGDADMAPDEIAAAIERAEGKRADLAAVPSRATAQILVSLPRAAQLYRDVIARGIEKNSEASTQARLALSQLVCGEIKLTPDYEAGHLVAHFGLDKIALFKRGLEAHMTILLDR